MAARDAPIALAANILSQPSQQDREAQEGRDPNAREALDRMDPGASHSTTIRSDAASGEYYTAEQAGEVSQWGGEGVKDSPIAAGTPVTREAFEKVLNGETPNGQQLRQFESRRPGIDMTFSAPKSLSLMAYIAGDKRILGPEGAHLKAVQKTMAWVEKNLAETRKDVDGKKVPVQTGKLVYALFQHDTGRARDPQAHIHAVVANMTRMADGRSGTRAVWSML